MNGATVQAKLSPAKPEAGSTLVASVRVTRRGSPVKPAGVACGALDRQDEGEGQGEVLERGRLVLFRTPKGGKGRTMVGSVSFRAAGHSFTKRFSAKLG